MGERSHTHKDEKAMNTITRKKAVQLSVQTQPEVAEATREAAQRYWCTRGEYVRRALVERLRFDGLLNDTQQSA
jgi:hypothetical protein